MNSEITSQSAQVVIAVVPIVGIAIGGVILFFYLKTFSLLAGLLLVGVGITLSFLFALIDGFSYALLGGLLPLAVGICLLIFYKINPDFHDKK